MRDQTSQTIGPAKMVAKEDDSLERKEIARRIYEQGELYLSQGSLGSAETSSAVLAKVNEVMSRVATKSKHRELLLIEKYAKLKAKMGDDQGKHRQDNKFSPNFRRQSKFQKLQR